MKHLLKLLIFSLLLIVAVTACNSNQKEENMKPENESYGDDSSTESSTEYYPLMSADCIVSSFLEGLSKDYSYYENVYYYDNVYIIKGIVLDKIEYGIKISLVEDLRGNFPKNVNTFTVWGDGRTFIELNRIDNLTFYEKQDTLIMLLTPARDLSHMTPPGHKWLEKPEDYNTLGCTFSTLKLSGNIVTGYILANNDGWYDREQTMLYDDFEEELKELLIKFVTK